MDASQDTFLALTLDIANAGPAYLTELGPMVIAAAMLDVAGDTRSFARKFEAPHALVLRECVHLDDALGLLSLRDKGDKSGRVFFALTEKARQLCEVAQ